VQTSPMEKVPPEPRAGQAELGGKTEEPERKAAASAPLKLGPLVRWLAMLPVSCTVRNWVGLSVASRVPTSVGVGKLVG